MFTYDRQRFETLVYRNELRGTVVTFFSADDVLLSSFRMPSLLFFGKLERFWNGKQRKWAKPHVSEHEPSIEGITMQRQTLE